MSNTAKKAVGRGPNNTQFVGYYGLKIYWRLELQPKHGKDQLAVCLTLKHKKEGIESRCGIGASFKHHYLLPQTHDDSDAGIRCFVEAKIPEFLQSGFFGSPKTRTKAQMRFNAYRSTILFPVFAATFKGAVLKRQATWAESTKKDFLDGLGILNDLFNDTPACEVVPELCKDDLKKAAFSNYRVGQCLFALENLFEFWDGDNPWVGHTCSFRKITRPKPTGQANLKVLCFSEQEKAELAAAVSKNLHSGVDKAVAFAQELMLLRGLSAEEVCALKYSDLTENASYPGEKVLYIHARVESKGSRNFVVNPLTEAGYRKIPLSTFLIRELETLLDGREQDKDEFIVFNPKNRKRALSPDSLLKQTVKDWASILDWSQNHPNQALTAYALEQLSKKTLLENLCQRKMSEGAIAYLLGAPPHLTSSINYSGFDSDIYQHMMAAELETLDNCVSTHYSQSEVCGQIISDTPQALWPVRGSIASMTLNLDAQPVSHIRIHAPHNLAEVELFPSFEGRCD